MLGATMIGAAVAFEGGEGRLASREVGSRVITILMRPRRGRFDGGRLDQVLRPIRTAFVVLGTGCGELDGGCEMDEGCGVMEDCGVEADDCGGGAERGAARFVTRAKKASSRFRSGQGRLPRKPMPSEGVLARISVRGGREGILGRIVVGTLGVGVDGFGVEWGGIKVGRGHVIVIEANLFAGFLF